MTAYGKDNYMWKGGRTISSHGYILVRVGKKHHLADVRGYAYEHRIVAEKLLGRWLKFNELIHHKDGNRQNNNPNNIEIVDSNGKHYVFHRKNQNLRSPGEVNSIVPCACGCGNALLKYDNFGRPRRYISGHNMKDERGTHYARRSVVD